MKKKGIVVGQMILWALGIAGVFFILYAFFGPGKALAKTADAGLSVGQEVLPGEEVAKISEKSQVPSGLVESLSQLASKIRDAKTGEKCLVDIGEIKIPENYVISLSEGKAEINRVKEGGLAKGEISMTPLKTETIDGLKPCIVQNLPAVYFHYCYLAKKMPSKDYTMDAYCKLPLFETSPRIILEKGEEYSKYLFKSGENYCVIKFYGAWGGGCDPPENKGAEGIDFDCRDRINEKNIPLCT